MESPPAARERLEKIIAGMRAITDDEADRKLAHWISLFLTRLNEFMIELNRADTRQAFGNEEAYDHVLRDFKTFFNNCLNLARTKYRYRSKLMPKSERRKLVDKVEYFLPPR